MKKEWKDIKGYEGVYIISNDGEIKSLTREIPTKNGKFFIKKGQIIKTQKNKNGYYIVCLYKNNIREAKYVHRLVAEHFCKKEKDKNTVNHKDGNKENNSFLNLEWCSYSDNNKHCYDLLERRKVRVGGKPRPVSLINCIQNKEVRYSSIESMSRAIGLSPTQIRRYLCSNKYWKEIYKIIYV